MFVTVLGHAALLFEHDSHAVLVDPIFFDPFEGRHVSCPERLVDVDRLPRITGVVLTHHHSDHLDTRSLRMLPRDIALWCPPGACVRAAKKLGFTHITPVKGGDQHKHGAMDLYFSDSRAPWREVGVVVSVPHHGTVWNQADSTLDERIILDVLSRFHLDAVFAVFNPLLMQGGTWVQERQFPRSRYEYYLEAAAMCQARAIIPCSSGQRAELSSPIDNIEYPASREKFLHDLRDLSPQTQGLLVNPGDVLDLSSLQVRAQASPFVRTTDPNTHAVEFKPPPPSWPELVDDNEAGHSYERFVGRLQAMMQELYIPRLQQTAGHRLLKGPLRRLRDRRHTFEIRFVLPLGMPSAALAWHVNEWTPLTMQFGRHAAPDYTFSFIASDILTCIDAVTLGKTPSLAVLRRRYERRTEGDPERLLTLAPDELFDAPKNYVDQSFLWDPFTSIMMHFAPPRR